MQRPSDRCLEDIFGFNSEAGPPAGRIFSSDVLFDDFGGRKGFFDGLMDSTAIVESERARGRLRFTLDVSRLTCIDGLNATDPESIRAAVTELFGLDLYEKHLEAGSAVLLVGDAKRRSPDQPDWIHGAGYTVDLHVTAEHGMSRHEAGVLTALHELPHGVTLDEFWGDNYAD